MFSIGCVSVSHPKQKNTTPPDSTILIYDINRKQEVRTPWVSQFNFHPMIQSTLYRTENHEKFEYITYIGTSPACAGQPFLDEPRDKPNFCLTGMKVLEEQPHLVKSMMDMMDHLPTTHVKKRYMKVLHKSDKLGVYPDNDDFSLAIEYTKQMLSFMLGVRGSPTFEYNAQAATGVPWNKMKDSKGTLLVHKGDFVKSPEYQDYMNMNYDPVFQASTKHEFLPSEELIQDDKQRVFYSSDTQFALWQKSMCDPSGEALQEHSTDYHRCWSRYGFTKQYGGINRLAHAHMRNSKGKLCDTFLTSDISGWDKLLPLLKQVWRIRCELYGNMTELEKQKFELFERNLAKSFICTPEGHIYLRHCGNVSGSGTTTSDNTIAHILIKFYLFIRLFRTEFDREPTYLEIVEFVVLSIYGDDDLSSLVKDDWFDGTQEEWFSFLKDFVRSIYTEFGLTVKESAFKVQSTLEGLEFLGSTFRFVKGTWLGEPRYGKIASSLLQFLEKPKTPQALCSTSQAVCYLLAGIETEESKILLEFNQFYAENILKQFGHNLTLGEVNDLRKIVVGRFDSMHLATGWESSPCTTGFLEALQ
jgi:hypothetical protein